MKYVLKNLVRRKLRALFSVMGVGLGVSIMVALFSISDDLVGQIQNAFETQRGDITVQQATAEELESDVPATYEGTLKEKFGDKIGSISPIIVGMLRTEGDFHDRPAILYFGITENNPIVPHMKILEGEPPSDADNKGVVFGKKVWEVLADKMGEKAPKVGGELNLLDIVTSSGFGDVFGKPKEWDSMSDLKKRDWALIKLKSLGVHVDAMDEESDESFTARTGKEPPPKRLFMFGLPEGDEAYYARVLESHGIDLNIEENRKQMKLQLYVRGVCETGIMLQDAAIYFPLEVAQLIRGKHERVDRRKVKDPDTGRSKLQDVAIDASVTAFLITVNDEGLTEEQRAALVVEIRDQINVEIDELRAVRSADVLQRHKEIDFLKQFGLIISLIAALAGAVGILNTMTLAVYERTREIGLLLAVGWSRKRILSTILLEGILLSIMGGIVGVGFGYTEVWAGREFFGMDFLSGSLNMVRSGQALALTFVIGVLATLYPAIRASLMTPINALGHE
ncbi:ABC transporter permease [Planctomycetota bacterium]|nr:ABC transporter permease [Planctomycetota bacterium]